MGCFRLIQSTKRIFPQSVWLTYATNLAVREAFSELRSLEILDFIGI